MQKRNGVLIMARQKATEKPTRESFTLNTDNERDRAIKLFLSTQNNKAEFVKNVLYKYIINNDANNGNKIDVILEDNIKNYTNINTKNDNNINESVKNDTKNSTNNYIIDINEDEEAFENAFKGLGL